MTALFPTTLLRTTSAPGQFPTGHGIPTHLKLNPDLSLREFIRGEFPGVGIVQGRNRPGRLPGWELSGGGCQGGNCPGRVVRSRTTLW